MRRVQTERGKEMTKKNGKPVTSKRQQGQFWGTTRAAPQNGKARERTRRSLGADPASRTQEARVAVIPPPPAPSEGFDARSQHILRAPGADDSRLSLDV